MLPFRRDVIACRKFLDHFDVRGKPRAREYAFKQIVTEHCIVRYAASERGFKSIDVIDPFAGIRAFAKKILVNIRGRRRVGIHSTRSCEDALIARPFAIERE